MTTESDNIEKDQGGNCPSDSDMTPLLYAQRDIEALDEAGGFYTKHAAAMTAEDLNSKSAIAAELAYRDKQLKDLKCEVKMIADFGLGFALCQSDHWATRNDLKKEQEKLLKLVEGI